MSKLKIFEGISEPTVSEILTQSERQNFAAWETIMEQGDEPDGKGYIIESGKVNISIDGEVTTSLGEGEIFGEFALLNEEARTATVNASEETVLIVLSQDALFEMIASDDSSISKEVMRRMEENLEKEV